MPLQLHRIFGGIGSGRRFTRAHQSGHGSSTTGQTSSKGRRSKEPRQSRKADTGKTPSSHRRPQNIDYNTSEFEEIMKPLLPLSIKVTALEAKLEESKALHARWKTEDAKDNLQGEELVVRQCKEIGLIVFGFTLRDAQVDAIWTMFFERRDLLRWPRLVLAKA